ncbi:MAG TPA: YqiA/YcfP family alpha/beta fold hydrolase [Moraxellaceae bacterium]|nr:YqiA/YcfP family alpha/beta fold hydrolase [Moraxellaceae bacterium]
MKDLIYIHGFLSSPQSLKARQLVAWAREHHPDIHVHAPALPVDPVPALGLLESTLEACSTTPGVIGSSLGGFYANILAARHGLRAVLVNPAVHPHRVMRHYIGLQRNYYTHLVSMVTPGHFRWLEHMEVRPPYPERLWVLLETGDETLDYRLAERFYADSHLDITPGGSHAYEGFVDKLPAIWEFLSKKTV